MTRGAIDLDGRPGARRLFEQTLEGQGIAGLTARRAVGGVGDDVHERVTQHALVPLQDARRRMPVALVHRRQHDVQPLQD